LVADLGCGTGRLTLGSAYLGAQQVIGVDLDRSAIEAAKHNTATSGQQSRVQWVLSDVTSIVGRFDTVIQNPPFGVLRRGADRIFITKALETGDVVYSLHKSGLKNRAFIKRLAERHGGIVTEICQLRFEIPHTFTFHHKKKHLVKVDLFRMIRNA
jgi:putative methylase